MSVLKRRDLLHGAATATSAVLLAGGAVLMARRSVARPTRAIRPPGALPEAQFLAACVRCGLCVRDCPPQILRLSRWGEGRAAQVAVGTPYFEARTAACEMCEDIPCAKVCPTGALDARLGDIAQARMGTAQLARHADCLNARGMRCDECYRACPLMGQAITLEPSSQPRSSGQAVLLPTVHADHCTGCGKCEQHCVLAEPAIQVLPAAAHGRAGALA